MVKKNFRIARNTDRRRNVRTRFRKTAFPRYNGIFKMTQEVKYGAVGNTNISEIVPTGFSYQFKLSDVEQYVTLTSLFDQYRIDYVRLQFIPRTVITNAQGSSLQDVPSYFISVVDYDDATVPTTEQELREYGNSKTHNVVNGKSITMFVKPHVALAAYGGGAFTSYANGSHQWIDAGSPGVSHYGVKIIFPPCTYAAAIGSIRYDVHAKFYLSFKNVR